MPSLGQGSGLFGATGADADFRRVDQAFLYYRSNGSLLSRLSVECPGNDDNTTIWVELDTQTAGETLDPIALASLAPYFDYHRSIITSLLSDVLPVDCLDGTHPKMMVHRRIEGAQP